MSKILATPENMTAAPDYSMTADGQPVKLCELPGYAGGTISIAFLEIDSETNITINCNSKVKTAAVHPLSYGVKATVENGKINFSINKPANYCVFVNDCFSLPIYIFAYPKREEIKVDENVIHFKAGVHEIGHFKLESGQTLLLDEGAVLKGTVYAVDAENVKICGRGIIRTSHIPFCNDPDKATEVLGLVRCKNVTVEDVTIIDSFTWTVVLYECDNIHIDNIKILNERPWSTDGINPCNSAHVLIENCFIRTKDDCITVKGMNGYGRPCNGKKVIEDIVVKNCAFWSDNNNALVVGSETLAEHIRDIHFTDCDILKVTGTCADNAGAMSIICLHDGDLSDISFERINVEYTEAPLINVFYTDEIFRIPGMRRPEGGTVKNLLFKDISLTGGPFRWSYIKGMDEKRTVDNVVIDNLNILGKRVLSAEDAELECQYANNVKII